MSKILVFVNQKGGVGKTTSALNIGAYFALSGKRTLLVDFDPQGNMSSGVGADKNGLTVYDAISGICKTSEAIQKTVIEKLSVLPANINLSGATIELVDVDKREHFLENALLQVKDVYDYVLIDCPPSLGILTLNGLVAADEVLVPLQCEYFALEGLTLLLKTVKRVQSGLNKKLEIGGIFFTMYDSRTRLAQEVVQQVSTYFEDRVLKTIIPRNVRLSEAPSHGLPICKYEPSSIGAKSYNKLAEEILKRGEK
ncbi:MAG: chromosome partitioning protein [Treponema sp.]|nr:MAG: chromosome partitioning protein [Treponema sp.]